MPSTESPDAARRIVRIGHSPDPDDAFMWFPLTGVDESGPLIDTGGFKFIAVAEDIESLNQRAQRDADLEITAISCAQYPFVADRYALTTCGASMGDGYGPRIVAREPGRTLEQIAEHGRFVVPGERTSAMLTLRMRLEGRPLRYDVVPFDRILEAVADGQADAGLVIHEGQLTYQQHGLVLIEDLGAWWTTRHHLPLPLGANAIRRDLDDRFGPGTLGRLTARLVASIHYALEHRDEAIEYAMRFGRGLDRRTAERFVGMYVNKLTLDYGQRGRQAVARFLIEAGRMGLAPAVDAADFVEPAA